jgi:uncharacterized protein (TIGR03435 family)
MKRAIAGVIFAALFSSGAFCQSADAPAATPPATFTIADVHPSVRTGNGPTFFAGAILRGDRYVVHNATMVDMITTAYGVDADKVLGGPSWLEMDRFDVIAKAPAGTKQENTKVMLQALLADRFKLLTHTETKPLQAYALTVGKGKPKLKEADGSGTPGCQPRIDPPNPTPGANIFLIVSCHNVTMKAFAVTLHQFGTNILSSPVADLTGLKGAWDFDLKWSLRTPIAQPSGDTITIFDAIDKQLGLKLEMQKVPLPVIVVDSAMEKPTDNPPGIVTALPAPPPTEFEVAIIKPSLPGANMMLGMDRGGQVNIQGVTLKFLITFAWNLNPNDSDSLVGAPKWLDSDHYDITGKTSTDGPVQQVGFDDLQTVLRALLIDRFKMVVHMEERPVSAYTLVAEKPKLTKADPTERTKCKEGPGPDGKDPRVANPVLNRLMTCQNMTMTQFAAQLQTLAGGYIYSPVKDATELEGGWDFTLSFSGAGLVNGGGGGGRGADAPPPPSGGATPTASDPNGALSLFDAISKQLGLKLVKEKRPAPVLVIDHIDEKPTDN